LVFLQGKPQPLPLFQIRFGAHSGQIADPGDITGSFGHADGAAGIQKITATTGKKNRDILVSSPWGSSYFGWPKDVKPMPFTIEVGKGSGTATISAPGFSDANKADYKAAIDAVVPVAIAKTADNKAAKEHTRR